MPDRAEDIKELEALDQRVDELLADVEQAAERIDAAIPDPPGDLEASEFESAEEAMGMVSQELAAQEASAATPAALSATDAQTKDDSEEAADPSEFESADDALSDAAAQVNSTPTLLHSPVADQEPLPRPPAKPSAVHMKPDLSAEEFSSPEAITKLDERLAASAKELSEQLEAGEVVDDSETEAQIAAGVAAAAPPQAPAAPIAATAPVAATPQAPATPAASGPMPAPLPAPAPAQAHTPAAPVAKPVAAPATPAPAAAPAPSAPAPAHEPAAAKPHRPRTSVGAAAAAPLRPLAVFTSKMKPGTRQTIAYAAVVTLFQAACLWGFLALKGPPGEPMPTSDPVILRQPGDPPASQDSHKAPAKGHAAPKKADSHDKPATKKTASKPKAGAKKDEHADAGHH